MVRKPSEPKAVPAVPIQLLLKASPQVEAQSKVWCYDSGLTRDIFSRRIRSNQYSRIRLILKQAFLLKILVFKV